MNLAEKWSSYVLLMFMCMFMFMFMFCFVLYFMCNSATLGYFSPLYNGFKSDSLYVVTKSLYLYVCMYVYQHSSYYDEIAVLVCMYVCIYTSTLIIIMSKG